MMKQIPLIPGIHKNAGYLRICCAIFARPNQLCGLYIEFKSLPQYSRTVDKGSETQMPVFAQLYACQVTRHIPTITDATSIISKPAEIYSNAFSTLYSDDFPMVGRGVLASNSLITDCSKAMPQFLHVFRLVVLSCEHLGQGRTALSIYLHKYFNYA